MKEMWDIVRSQPIRTSIAELLTLCAIAVSLYGLTILASGLVEP